MAYPVPQPNMVNYQPDKFEQLLVSDFKGGLNITDPIVTLPPNQFTAMQNYYFDRQGTIYSRPPYRPYCFSSSTVDKPCQVDVGGNTYTPSAVHEYQVFRETLSNGWSYNDEVHVVSGYFECSGETTLVMVAVFNSTSNTWIDIWVASDAATTEVSVCPYKINQAFDLLIFPDDKNPERWQPTATAGTLSDLGLTAPTAADSFTATGTASDSAEGMARIAAGKAYYKFSFFYDDENTSTKYGESATTVVTDGNCDDGIVLAADATKKMKVSIAFTTVTVAANISKVMIYRAPDSTPEGPYKLIGETAVTSTTAITTFVDTTPWGEEGVEDIPAGSNPSLSGSELSVVNAKTVGGYIIGFDASMPHKAIRCVSGQPDVWKPLDYDYLNNTGETAIEFNRKIYLFTQEAVYQKDPTNMDIDAVKICNIGTIDGLSVQDVGNGLIWMDYDTVYFADFVQQYGSKGDFPRDIGHNISKSVRRRTTGVVSSCFFERRYYLAYTDSVDGDRRTYVYDVDIGAWTQHSANHYCWARGDDTLFSLGVGDSRYYAYEHDYSDSVSVVTGRSDYAGRDYHDYDYVLTPLMHYKLDEDAASTDVEDSGSSGQDGVCSIDTNTAGFSVTGEVDTAFDFDYNNPAASPYIDIPDNADFNFFNGSGDKAFSIGAFIQANGIDNRIIGKYDWWNDVYEWCLYVDSNNFARIILYTDDSNYIEARSAEAIGTSPVTWQHVTATYDGSETSAGLKIHIDGSDGVNTYGTDSGSYTGMVDTGEGVCIASDNDHRKGCYTKLDNITIYDHQLNNGDAAALAGGASSFFGGMAAISSSIGRDNIRLAGDYRKAFVSSLSIEAEGSVIDVTGVIKSQDNTFSVSKSFISGSNSEQITTGAFVFGQSKFGTGVFAGFAGNTTAAMHKKIKRTMKSNAIGISLVSTDSRNLKILYIVLYWKPLSPVA